MQTAGSAGLVAQTSQLAKLAQVSGLTVLKAEPMLLNMTQSFKTGPGYTVEEVMQHIKFNKTSILKQVKKKGSKLLNKVNIRFLQEVLNKYAEEPD